MSIRSQPTHSVTILQDSLVGKLLGMDALSVNSYHHQAIRKLAPDLEVMAESEDGLVEAVYMPSKTFVWALQWHPEFAYKTDKDSRKIFRAFVDSMKDFGKTLPFEKNVVLSGKV